MPTAFDYANQLQDEWNKQAMEHQQTLGQALQNQKAQQLMPFVTPQAQAQLQLTQGRIPLEQQQTLADQLANEKNRQLLQFVTPEAQAKLQSDQVTPALDRAKIESALASAKLSNLKLNNPELMFTSGAAAPISQLNFLEQNDPNNPNIPILRATIDAINKKNLGMGQYYGANAQFKYVPKGVVSSMIANNLASVAGDSGSASPTSQVGSGVLLPGQTLNQQSQIQNAPAVREAAQDTYLKETTPGPIQSQRYYEATASNIFNQGNKYEPSVEKYAGYSGSVKNLIDSVGSKFGVNNPDYQNLQAYIVNTTLLSNELRRALGSHASDSERQVMERTASRSDIENMTPQQVRFARQQLGVVLNSLGNVLKQTPSQIHQQLGKEADTTLGRSLSGGNKSSGQNAILQAIIAEKKRRGIK